MSYLQINLIKILDRFSAVFGRRVHTQLFDNSKELSQEAYGANIGLMPESTSILKNAYE
jgi:hypothetical protein